MSEPWTMSEPKLNKEETIERLKVWWESNQMGRDRLWDLDQWLKWLSCEHDGDIWWETNRIRNAPLSVAGVVEFCETQIPKSWRKPSIEAIARARMLK